MKASLRFRDDQKPLFKAKVPLNVLGVPFQSGVAAGETKELSLNLSTFFESGPSFKITYRPNDSWNPFSLVVKTGIGPFGSPISAPMSMSAEFNLVGRGNPSFFVHFRPQFGDFRIKKSVASPTALQSEKPIVFIPAVKSHSKDVDSDPDAEEIVDGGETSVQNGLLSGKKINGLLTEKNDSVSLNSILNGVEVSARTVLPVRSRAVVKFRWGVRFPAGLENPFANKGIRNPTAMTSLSHVPLLVMNKISIAHVAEELPKEESKRVPPLHAEGEADAARMCFSVKRQLEALQSENVSLRRAVEELRSEMGAGRFVPAVGKQSSVVFRDAEVNGGSPKAGKNGRDRGGSERKSSEHGGGFAGKVTEGDVSEELKKALMGASGAGA